MANIKILAVIGDLLKTLSKFSIGEVLEFEEKYDRQFLALKDLYKKINDKELFLKLVLLNSIVSYQLPMKGEEYWIKFSEYFSKKEIIILPEDLIEFLKKYNKRFLQNKIRRVQKLWEFIKDKSLTKYCCDLIKLNKDLAKIMKQKESAKTITFSVKMFGYACRIIKNQKIVFPKETFIPLDNRLKKIAEDKNFWIKLSEKTNTPLLHIDSLIWITLGLSNEEIEKIENKRLKEKIKRLKDILNQLLSS